MVEPELFDRPCGRFHAHVDWNPIDGWSLWVNSWLEGFRPGSGRSEGYSYMTFDECLQVLEAEKWSRVERGQNCSSD